MESLKNILAEKKAVIAFGIFIVIIAISVIMTLLSTGASPLPEKSGNGPTGYSIQPTMSTTTTPEATISTSPSPSTNQNWDTYTSTSNTYHIARQKDWKVTVNPVEGGGSLVTIQPDALPVGVNYPLFSIEEDQTIQDSIDDRSSIYQAFHFVRTTTDVSGVTAVKETGTMPVSQVAGQTINQPLQETAYFLDHNGKQYIIKYQYNGSTVNQTLDAYFAGMLGTFTFL